MVWKILILGEINTFAGNVPHVNRRNLLPFLLPQVFLVFHKRLCDSFSLEENMWGRYNYILETYRSMWKEWNKAISNTWYSFDFLWWKFCIQIGLLKVKFITFFFFQGKGKARTGGHSNNMKTFQFQAWNFIWGTSVQIFHHHGSYKQFWCS